MAFLKLAIWSVHTLEKFQHISIYFGFTFFFFFLDQENIYKNKNK